LLWKQKLQNCAELKQFDLWSWQGGVQHGMLEVTLLCGMASGLASSLRSSLPPWRVELCPSVTWAIKQAVFSHHVSNEAVLGRKRLKHV